MNASTFNDGIASLLAETPPELALGLMVKGTLILVAVFIAVFLIRRQAAAIRHFVWILSFVGLALLPLLSVLLPPIPVNLLPAPSTESISLAEESLRDSLGGESAAPNSMVGSPDQAGVPARLQPDRARCDSIA